MLVSLHTDGRSLELTFDDRDEIQAFLVKSQQHGLMVRLEDRLADGDELQVRMRCGDDSLAIAGRVKQVFRSGDLNGTVLEVDDWSPAGASWLRGDGGGTSGAMKFSAPIGESPPPMPAAAAPAERSARPSQEVESTVAEPSLVGDDHSDDNDGMESDTSETRGRSAIFEIKRLNPSERMRLAARAGRPERQILLRDSSPQVLMQLLANPWIETKEVVEIVKNPQAASGVLQRVAQDRRFSSNYEIQVALVKNPRTPSPVAIRLLELLRTPDLRQLAKSQNLRENVRKAALRIVLKRS